MIFADADFGMAQIVLQGGAFALLAVILIYGGPILLRTQKEHVDQLVKMFNDQQNAHILMIDKITQAMDRISETMSGFNRRLDIIEDHLDIPTEGKKGIR